MPPRRRLVPGRFWIWLGLAVLIGVRWVTLPPVSGQRVFTVPPLREGPCQIVRVISGDTLVVTQGEDGRQFTVKLISTNALPTAEARDFTRAFAAQGPARLVLDNHRLDSRGRYLAYVECGGAQLNEALVAAGLAQFAYFPGNSASMDRRLQEAEEAARVAQRGQWRAVEGRPIRLASD